MNFNDLKNNEICENNLCKNKLGIGGGPTYKTFAIWLLILIAMFDWILTIF